MMSEFEDNLWRAVVREHGEELAQTAPSGHERRRASRPRLAAGTTVGLAATATAAVLAFGASSSSPAFAVTRNPDGTVTVKLIKASGLVGANHTLANMGVPTQILAPAKSAPRLVCPPGTVPTITLDAGALRGRQVRIARPGAADNHVVRLLPDAGKLRTASGAGTSHVVQMYCR